MTLHSSLGTAGLLVALASVPSLAAGDHEMLAAEQELKIAKDHLQAAGPDYAGHRRAAIDHVDRALREIRAGIKLSRGEGQKPGAPAAEPKGPGETDDDD